MAQPQKAPFARRPKSKTPAERSVEFDATQARLKAEAAARHDARVAKARAPKRAD
jgi:hypothetical protein